MFRPPSNLNIITETSISNSTEHLPNLPPFNNPPNLHTKREISRPNSLHKEEILAARSFNQNLRLSRIDREGFFAEDVFACVEG